MKFWCKVKESVNIKRWVKRKIQITFQVKVKINHKVKAEVLV